MSSYEDYINLVILDDLLTKHENTARELLQELREILDKGVGSN